MTELSRRRLLAGTGTAFAGILAGCSSSAEDADEPDEDGEDDEDDSDEPSNESVSGDESEGDDSESDDESEGDEGETGDGETVLGEIGIENVHDEQHTVDVIVEVDGEIDHWTTHDLEAGGGTTLERDWSTDPSSFRVIVRLDDTEVSQINPSRWNDPSCLNLLALIGRDGELSVLSGTNGGHCGDGEATFS